MIRPWLALLTLVAGAVPAGPVVAQGTFPAPLPGSNPTVNLGDKSILLSPPLASGPGSFAPAPPTQGGSGPSACMKGFIPLREDAAKKGKLIKDAGARHAPPDEACKLVGDYTQAEAKMIKYVEANSAKCAIPGQVA